MVSGDCVIHALPVSSNPLAVRVLSSPEGTSASAAASSDASSAASLAPASPAPPKTPSKEEAAVRAQESPLQNPLGAPGYPRPGAAPLLASAGGLSAGLAVPGKPAALAALFQMRNGPAKPVQPPAAASKGPSQALVSSRAEHPGILTLAPALRPTGTTVPGQLKASIWGPQFARGRGIPMRRAAQPPPSLASARPAPGGVPKDPAAGNAQPLAGLGVQRTQTVPVASAPLGAGLSKTPSPAPGGPGEGLGPREGPGRAFETPAPRVVAQSAAAAAESSDIGGGQPTKFSTMVRQAPSFTQAAARTPLAAPAGSFPAVVPLTSSTSEGAEIPAPAAPKSTTSGPSSLVGLGVVNAAGMADPAQLRDSLRPDKPVIADGGIVPRKYSNLGATQQDVVDPTAECFGAVSPPAGQLASKDLQPLHPLESGVQLGRGEIQV